MNLNIFSILSKIRSHRVQNSVRFRKKGTIMVEFLASVPLFFALAWITWQILFFSSSIATAQNAALEGAHYLSNELRGFNGDQLTTLSDDAKTRLQNGLLQRLNVITAYNGVFLLFHDSSSAQDPTLVWGDETTCKSDFSNVSQKRVICAYLSSDPSYADVKEVKVAVKGEYRILGNFIPDLQGKLFAKGYGFSILDDPDRYQYYTP